MKPNLDVFQRRADTPVSSKPLIVRLADPKVMAALSDFPMMQRWEVLRRNQAPMSAREFAAACSTKYEDAIASLDRLVDLGFVVRHKATARCRHVTFNVVADSILVAFEPTQADQREWIDAQRRTLMRYSRDAIDSHFSNTKPFGKTRYTEMYLAPRLSLSDRDRVSKILHQAFDAIREIEREAESRARRTAVEHAQGTPEPSSQYIVALHTVAVGVGVLPIPNISLVDATLVASRFSTLASNPKILLTQRELQVAERLASGESRPTAARSLGVSANTIASTTKRIYTKLGVTNRAEFVSRMATLSRK